MIHFLLNDTSLIIRTKKVEPFFDTNIGISQKDGLSLVLFITYLEVALKEVRKNVHAQGIVYSDDIEFIGKNGVNLNTEGRNTGKVESEDESHENGDSKSDQTTSRKME